MVHPAWNIAKILQKSLARLSLLADRFCQVAFLQKYRSKMMTTTRFDKVEHEMGIQAYLSPDINGFAAVSKARFSDFLVHEVALDGSIARLTSTTNDLVVSDEASNKRQKVEKHHQASSEKEVEKSSSSNADDWKEEAKSQLCALVHDVSVVQSVIDMLDTWENADSSATNDTAETRKYVTLPVLPDKKARRSVHQLIKSPPLSRFALGDTHEGQIRIWHKRFEREMPNFGKFERGRNNNNNNTRDDRGRKSKKRSSSSSAMWPSDRPDYLQFVMYKENIDTGVAVKDIGLSLPGKARLGYAGMKDKRGVTSQFCTVKRTNPEELMRFLVRGDKDRDEDGDGSGGHGNSRKHGAAVIRVGNFSFVKEDIQLGQLAGNRFDIVLRNVCVKKEQQDTKTTLAAAATALKQNGFINYFGMQRFGKYYDTHITGCAALRGDFQGACHQILRVKPDEPERTTEARKKWAARFDGIPEDDEAARKAAEGKVAKEVAGKMGRFCVCEVAILNSLRRNPCNYKQAFDAIPRRMRSMFLHANQSLIWNIVASKRIDMNRREVLEGDLVYEDSSSETSSSKEKKVRLVTQEDVANKSFTLDDVVLPLVGARIHYPTNPSGGMFDEELAKLGLTRDHYKNMGSDIFLAGDYRKLVCRPKDIDFDVVEYSDPVEPLLQTDLMKLQDQRINLSKLGEKGLSKTLVAMIIGFTLPPSAYATIALRELMKRPTSSDYQRLLQLEGPCDGKLTSMGE